MPHYDLSNYLADDALTLQGVASEKHPDGKAYTIASPSAKFGLQLRRAMVIWGTRDAKNPPTPEELTDLLALVTDDDGKPIDLQTRLMGPVYQQMVDDGVSDDRLQMIWDVVIAHYGSGSQVAQMIVEQATTGESQAPDQQDRDGATTGKTSEAASTDAAKPTRRRASRASSTTRPTASAPQAKTG